MEKIVAIKKLMESKGPKLSSMKRAQDKGEKCCGGTFPHTHDNNESDRMHQLHHLMA